MPEGFGEGIDDEGDKEEEKGGDEADRNFTIIKKSAEEVNEKIVKRRVEVLTGDGNNFF